MTTQRYCIGCKHLKYEDKQMSHGSEYTGSWTSEEASMSCGFGYWKAYLTEHGKLFDLEQAMQKAATCEKYEERAI